MSLNFYREQHADHKPYKFVVAIFSYTHGMPPIRNTLKSV